MKRWWVAALCASTGLAGTAYAADKPVYAPAPAWVKPAPAINAATLTDASPAIVRLDQQQRLEDGQVWSYFDTAMRPASSQQLAEVGDIKLQWQPSQGDLVIHTAEILRGPQRIDLVKGGTPFTVLRRETELDQKMLDGALTATMAAEGLQVGDVLHVAFSITRRDPTLKGDMQAFAPLLTAPASVGFGRARLSWPEKAGVRWRSYLPDVTVKPVTAAGWTELEVALPVAKPDDVPNDAPLRFRPVPLVEATSFADWSAVSRAMAPLYATDGLIAAGSPLAAEADRIAAGSADPRVRAAAALRLVQDKVRYLMLGMDTGNYVPQTPAQTWERRFGDCKAKTLLLLALLHRLGVEAEPVAANLQLGEMVEGRLPSLGAFNHVLVRATVAGDTLWLDGTGSGTRIEDLADTPRLGSVLPLRKDGANLIAIALRPDARPDAVVEAELDDRGGVDTPTIVTASMVLRGGLAEAIGARAAQATPQQRTELAQKLLAEQVGNGTYIDPVVSYDAAAATVTIRAVGLANTRWTRSERRYRQPLDTAVGKIEFAPDRARAAWSAIPVATSGPETIVYRTAYRVPDGAKGYVVEGDRALPPSLAAARLARRFTMTGDTITVEDRIERAGAEVPAKDVPAMKAALAAAGNSQLALLAPQGAGGQAYWQAQRAAGRHKPVEAMFVRVIANDPKATSGYEWRARFRTGSNDRAGAIADYGRAIAIEPTVDLYLARAALLEETGQEAKQLADIKAARALDPGSDAAIGQLATYQATHGEAAAGVALVDERLARAGTKDRVSWLTTKASVQSDGGDAAAALKTLDEAQALRPGNPTVLNQRCWTRGTANLDPAAGLKDCTRAIELADNSADALDSRAMVQFRLARYDDALADLNAALDQEPEQAASLFMRGVVRARMGQDGAADLAAARLITPTVDKEFARYGIKP